MKKLFLLPLAIVMLSGVSHGQRKCGTMEYMEWLMVQDPALKSRREAIEQFTQKWIAENAGAPRTVYTIPVVFHVVYNTSAQNISDAQIMAQLDQLNADFRRTNSDASNTPSVWQSTAADCEIQFCLAQRDPNGNPTNGIIRKSTTVTSFSSNNNIKFNSTGGSDAWPASSYLNVWIGNLSGGLLGYAQFPGGNASTDGVVVHYTTVGSISSPGSGTPFHLGRTLTHEVGHWLNLYHIWGDDGTSCSGSDQVSDTPNQAGATSGCPSFPKTDACTGGPNGIMFMNYMDYTNDACMNMFTAGQKTRMRAVLATGGARASLASSLGCTPPSTSCATPTGVTASSITSSSATISWGAVSGASSYNVQYKPSSSSTWTTISSSSTSVTLTGLTASTTYNVQVQAVCSGGSSAYSSQVSFTTSSSGGGPSYCASNGNSQQYEFIDYVAIGSIARTSGAEAGGYYNGTSLSTTVNKGINYTLTVSAGFTGTVYTEQWAVFIDWNIDGDFADAGETAASFSSSGSGNVSVTISVPSTAATGTTRMRVSMRYGSAPPSCGSFDYGEVEDYSLNIQTGSSTCTDVGEPGNNSSSTPMAITVGTTLSAQISSSTDKDWYSFSNSSSAKHIKITLTNLPADYDIKLYNPSGTNVKTSENSGTTNETIIYNNGPVGTYKIQVYGWNGAHSTTQCYNLLVQTSSSPFRYAEDGETVNEFPAESQLVVYPNPVSEQLTLKFTVAEKGPAQVHVYNLMGERLFAGQALAVPGSNVYHIPVYNWAPALYVIEVVVGQHVLRQPFMVSK
ncbi:MAG: M43 family zinc metalloprotease [Chitinophagales bacterium]|nr:M43 family zinc metalloprotease [Chitinophagales bacterium]MDW8428213.1 GEVED domain-containing protein [Chitinophagales bacterium]